SGRRRERTRRILALSGPRRHGNPLGRTRVRVTQVYFAARSPVNLLEDCYAQVKAVTRSRQIHSAKAYRPSRSPTAERWALVGSFGFDTDPPLAEHRPNCKEMTLIHQYKSLTRRLSNLRIRFVHFRPYISRVHAKSGRSPELPDSRS